MTQEEKRVQAFNQRVEELKAQGYQMKELFISAKKANIVVTIAAIPMALIFLAIFIIVHGFEVTTRFNFKEWVIFMIGIVVLIVVHELIHGFFFSIWCKNKFKSLQFGFEPAKGVAYCYCEEPLTKGQYIIGALMPGLLLGVIPLIISMFNGSFLLFMIGLTMVAGAGGDAIIISKLLRFRAPTDDVIYMDHPSEPGVVAFYR